MVDRGELTERQKRAWWLFVSALLLAFPALAPSKTSTDAKGEARAAYERAVDLRRTLEAQPEASRRKADYEKLLRAFQSVYRLDPAYSKTPAALAAVAEIYQEMGRIFSTQRYFEESARAYQFLFSEYPNNSFSRDALYALGELYRTDLAEPEEARKTFQKFAELYPKSPLASGARKKLQELPKTEEEHAASPAEKAVGLDKQTGTPPEVTAVRRWVGPNYSRIVIGLDGEAKFDTSRLRNPDRIVLDLLNARVSPVLASGTFPVEDGYLRQVRIAQYRPNVTRVVLDVEKIDDYSIFTLPNPFRLVIDIHGAPTPVAEKSPPPILKASETSRTPAVSPDSATPAPARVAEGQKTPKEPAAQPENPAGKSAQKAEKRASGRDNGPKETASLKTPVLPPPTDPGLSRSRDAAIRVKPAAPTESGDRTLTRALGLKIGRVVIDPGHGGHDTGTIGPAGLREKDVVLDVALRLKKLIERKSGSSVVLTRSDDTFVPLEERTAIANEKAADLFISIHANASSDPEARGVETYYLNFTSSPEALEVAARENATSQESVHELQDLIKRIALTEKVRESQEFARLIQREVHNALAKAGASQRDRGLKKAPFVVLIGANMPSILVEISFLSNPRDERLLKKSSYRQRFAASLCQGISRYTNTLGRMQVAERTRHTVAPPAPSRTREPVQDSGRDF